MIVEYLKEKIPAIKRATYLATSLTATILIANAVWGYGQAFNVFTLEKVNISGSKVVSTEEIFNIAGIEFGDNLLEIDLRRTSENLRNNPFVEDVIISKELPGTISIGLLERQPVAFLSAGEFYSIDEHGIILPSATHMSFDLPVITGLEEITMPAYGNKLSDNRVQKALELVRLLSAGSLPITNVISEININEIGEAILIGLKKGTVIYLGNNEYEEKISYLKSLLVTVRPSGGLSKYKYVDLRFKNQVVVKERSS